ncbi:hypothetical protein ACPFUC_003488 [Vibrio cholerae]|uniref:hypothetical protein n=1 Tax=Vibrio fluvialis TaxID=676 RepID=UPI0025736320|nr:hypothetical protein [Vibrio fluvialis]EGR4421446.1 hypothetical protein [Vibrio cholerae]BEI26546.1 hypothetical protein KKIDH5335_48780 [Vibrio fluvialis]
MLSTLKELQSCFLVELTPEAVEAIRKDPFLLACGENLNVGDTFTEIGSSGSAGNLPVTLSEPWVQRYMGLLNTDDVKFDWLPDNWLSHDLVLFDAFNPNDLSEGFVSPAYRAKWQGTKSKGDGFYIAYLRHCDNQLFHTRGGSASSVCQCTSLTRWAPKVQNEH